MKSQIKDSNIYDIIAIFFITYILNTLFIFQGIDLFDTGVHLTHQIAATLFPIELGDTWPVIFLTDLIGGTWLRFINGPSLIWARLGGVLVTSINAIIIFSILSNYFDRNKVFFATIICTLFITTTSALNIIDYYTFPALLINISAWLFNKILIENIGSIKSYIYGFLFGFMFVPIILSKFTLISVLLIPTCLIIYNKFSEYRIVGIKNICLPAFVGLTSAIILFYIFYEDIGVSSDYTKYILYTIIDYVINNPGSSGAHPMKGMLSVYKTQYICAVIGGFGFSLLILSKYFLNLRFNIRITNALIFIFIMVCIYLVYVLIINRVFRPEFLVTVLFDVVIGILILSSIISIHLCRNSYVNSLIIIGLIIMLITPLGSNTGIMNSVLGMWLILPLSILCMDKIKRCRRNKKLGSALPSFRTILATILIVSILFHFAWVYGDDLNRMHLNTAFSSPPLLGIFSTSEKVMVVDELILNMKNYTNKGDYVIFSSNMPLFYYLTETRPSINPAIEGNISHLIRKKDKISPKIIILSKTDTSKRNWPDKDTISDTNNSLNIEKLKRNYVNYSLLWENKAFAIYGV